MTTLAGFLRGINVGGHHKVPMAELREKLTAIGCTQVKTLLNSGNIVFEADTNPIEPLEQRLEDYLSQLFGFPIPIILRTQKEISALVDENPFAAVHVHKDIRCYVSFLKDTPTFALPLPYTSADNSFRIIAIQNKTILSVLDLSATTTPKGMDDLEKLFGKNITTRNWNTVVKVGGM